MENPAPITWSKKVVVYRTFARLSAMRSSLRPAVYASTAVPTSWRTSSRTVEEYLSGCTSDTSMDTTSPSKPNSAIVNAPRRSTVGYPGRIARISIPKTPSRSHPAGRPHDEGDESDPRDRVSPDDRPRQLVEEPGAREPQEHVQVHGHERGVGVIARREVGDHGEQLGGERGAGERVGERLAPRHFAHPQRPVHHEHRGPREHGGEHPQRELEQHPGPEGDRGQEEHGEHVERERQVLDGVRLVGARQMDVGEHELVKEEQEEGRDDPERQPLPPAFEQEQEPEGGREERGGGADQVPELERPRVEPAQPRAKERDGEERGSHPRKRRDAEKRHGRESGCRREGDQQRGEAVDEDHWVWITSTVSSPSTRTEPSWERTAD